MAFHKYKSLPTHFIHFTCIDYRLYNIMVALHKMLSKTLHRRQNLLDMKLIYFFVFSLSHKFEGDVCLFQINIQNVRKIDFYNWPSHVNI